MLWKKGIFSNLIWFVMTVILFCGLLIFTDYCIDSFTSLKPGMEYAICSGILIVVCLLVLLFRKFVVILGLDDHLERKNRAVIESVLEVLMIAGGLAVRLQNCFEVNNEANPYYSVARLTERGDGFSSVNGLVDMYHGFLRIICLVFGNRFEVCVISQLVLYVIAGVVMALAVQKLAGGFPMLMASALFCFSPYMISMSVVLSPVVFYMIVYFSSLLVLALFIKHGARAWGLGLLAGIITGFAIYLDVFGITLLVVAISGIYLERKEERPFLNGVLCLLEMIGFTIVFLALYFWIQSAVSGIDYLYSVYFWYENYIPGELELPVIGINFILSDVEQLIVLIVLICEIIGIYTYWISYRFEKISVWIMLFVSGSIIYCMNISGEYFRGVPLIYLWLTVLAAIGITNFVKLTPVIDEPYYVGVDEPVEEAVEGSWVKEDVDASENDAIKIDEQKDAEEVKATEAEPESPKFVPIPNPLPLPKKHVKKVLDFDKAVTDEDDFDLNVSDNDDFDV